MRSIFCKVKKVKRHGFNALRAEKRQKTRAVSFARKKLLTKRALHVFQAKNWKKGCAQCFLVEKR